MALNVRKTGRLLFAFCSAAYLLIFLIFYIPNYALPEFNTELTGIGLDIYLIVRDILEQLLNFLAPLCSGVFLFLCMENVGRTLLGAITFTVPSFIYSLPYCYLYALSFGYDSVRAALISLGLSLLGGAIIWLHIVAVYFICRWVARRSANDILRESNPSIYRTAKNPNREANIKAGISELLLDDRQSSKLFEFGSPVIWSILIASICEFAVRVAIELINTVSFMINVRGLFVESEIATIIGSYLFLLLELILAYTASYGIKKYLNQESDNADDAEPTKKGENNAEI